LERTVGTGAVAGGPLGVGAVSGTVIAAALAMSVADGVA